MKVVSAAEMAAIDSRAAREWALPGALLMEEAGLRVWELLAPRLKPSCSKPGASIVFVVGNGANGGDALVMARHCMLSTQKAHKTPDRTRAFRPLLLAAAGLDKAMKDKLQICRHLGLPELDWQQQRTEAEVALGNADWIVDGITGTGLREKLRPQQGELVDTINKSRARVCSLDVPSGIGDHYRSDWLAVQADLTITIALPKRCLFLPAARPLCGELLIAPLGFPMALLDSDDLQGELLTADRLATDLPPLSDSTYKQRRGVVGIFAGSPGAAGAAQLAANAAARSAAGIVRLYVDAQIYPLPGPAAIMTTPLSAKPRQLQPELPASVADCHALLIGPGWGSDEQREALLLHLLETAAGGVLDADALNILARRRAAGARHSFRDRWILTPHPGECARLLGRPTAEIIADPFAAALEVAREFQTTVILKGHVSIVATAAGKWWVYDGNNAAMATAGSGDVLAGIVAAFMARGLPLGWPARRAARAGVLLHGLAGSRAWRAQGWFLADDLLPHLSAELSNRLGRTG